jgi:hypothetical protein
MANLEELEAIRRLPRLEHLPNLSMKIIGNMKTSDEPKKKYHFIAKSNHKE